MKRTASIPVPERSAIREMYLSGMHIVQIALATGYDRGAVSRALTASNAYALTGGRRRG